MSACLVQVHVCESVNLSMTLFMADICGIPSLSILSDILLTWQGQIIYQVGFLTVDEVNFQGE